MEKYIDARERLNKFLEEEMTIGSRDEWIDAGELYDTCLECADNVIESLRRENEIIRDVLYQSTHIMEQYGKFSAVALLNDILVQRGINTTKKE